MFSPFSCVHLPLHGYDMLCAWNHIIDMWELMIGTILCQWLSFFSLQALEAILMVLDLTNNKRIDSELLERITLEMEKRTSTRHPVSSEAANDDNCTKSTHPSDSNVIHVGDLMSSESRVGISWETENLVEMLGKVLQKVCEHWLLYTLYRWLVTPSPCGLTYF